MIEMMLLLWLLLLDIGQSSLLTTPSKKYNH